MTHCRHLIEGREYSPLFPCEVKDLCCASGCRPIPMRPAGSHPVEGHLLHYIAVETGLCVPDSLGELPVTDEPVDVPRGRRG